MRKETGMPCSALMRTTLSYILIFLQMTQQMIMTKISQTILYIKRIQTCVATQYGHSLWRKGHKPHTAAAAVLCDADRDGIPLKPQPSPRSRTSASSHTAIRSPILSFSGIHLAIHVILRSRLLQIYRPRRDGKLSWPRWHIHSGQSTHEMVTCQLWRLRSHVFSDSTLTFNRQFCLSNFNFYKEVVLLSLVCVSCEVKSVGESL